MGTSGSSKGPKNSSPLVPAGVDDEPGKPLPEPEGQRFRGFRTEFGERLPAVERQLSRPPSENMHVMRPTEARSDRGASDRPTVRARLSPRLSPILAQAAPAKDRAA